MDEVIYLFGFIAVIIVGAYIESCANHTKQEYYKISCLELNLGKETCDKIFNNKKE